MCRVSLVDGRLFLGPTVNAGVAWFDVRQDKVVWHEVPGDAPKRDCHCFAGNHFFVVKLDELWVLDLSLIDGTRNRCSNYCVTKELMILQAETSKVEWKKIRITGDKPERCE